MDCCPAAVISATETNKTQIPLKKQYVCYILETSLVVTILTLLIVHVCDSMFVTHVSRN